MNIPNMKTNQIKRLENDHFTVEPLSAFNDPGRLLCNHCAKARCNMRNYVRRLDKGRAVMKVQSCALFIPTLGFSVLQGLEGDLWNTVRIGAAWGRRLEPGMTVAIADTANKVMRDPMIVKSVYVGTLDNMLHVHAENNHAIKAEIEVGKIKHHQAPERLERILKNAYGTNIAASDRDASVIYLRRPD